MNEPRQESILVENVARSIDRIWSMSKLAFERGSDKERDIRRRERDREERGEIAYFALKVYNM